MTRCRRIRMLLYLAWFDARSGFPAVARVLVRRLGLGQALKLFGAVACRGLLPVGLDEIRIDGDPSAVLFSRHQFRSAVLLDDALRGMGGLSASDRKSILEEAIGAAGAKFIAANVPVPAGHQWRGWSPDRRSAYVSRLLGRFRNAEARVIEVSEHRVAFDVDRCFFAELARGMGRPELAGAYCAADRVYFDSPGSPVRLTRAETIATGGSRCPFRLEYAEHPPSGDQSISME